MRFSLFLLSVLLLFSFSWNTRHFNRLTALYAKNPEKCLKTSLRLEKWDGNAPAPYMFAAMIYLDQTSEARSLRSAYSTIGKSFNQAEKFEKFRNEELVESSLWKRYMVRIDSVSGDLYSRLKSDLKSDLARSLERKRLKLGFGKIRNSEVINDDKEIAEVSNDRGDETSENIKSNEYFGLPQGMEKISSFSYSEEQKMLQLINEERIRQGMQPLVWEEKLAEAARYHSCDMATQNYFNHDSYDRVDNSLIKVGKTFERIRKFYKDSFVNSENIAAGNAEADKTYIQWYNSSGHYKNMFNSESVKCGIGVFYDPNSTYKYYWVFCTAK